MRAKVGPPLTHAAPKPAAAASVPPPGAGEVNTPAMWSNTAFNPRATDDTSWGVSSYPTGLTSAGAATGGGAPSTVCLTNAIHQATRNTGPASASSLRRPLPTTSPLPDASAPAHLASTSLGLRLPVPPTALTTNSSNAPTAFAPRARTSPTGPAAAPAAMTDVQGARVRLAAAPAARDAGNNASAPLSPARGGRVVLRHQDSHAGAAAGNRGCPPGARPAADPWVGPRAGFPVGPGAQSGRYGGGWSHRGCLGTQFEPRWRQLEHQGGPKDGHRYGGPHSAA